MTIEYWRCIYDGEFAEGDKLRPIRAFRTFYGWDELTENAAERGTWVRCGPRPRNADGTYAPLRKLYGPGTGRPLPASMAPHVSAEKSEWRALLARLASDSE